MRAGRAVRGTWCRARGLRARGAQGTVPDHGTRCRGLLMPRVRGAGGLAHHTGVWDAWCLVGGAWGSVPGARRVPRRFRCAMLDTQRVVTRGVQHTVPTSGTARGTRCTTRCTGGQCMGRDTRGTCHSGARCITQHPPFAQAPRHLPGEHPCTSPPRQATTGSAMPSTTSLEVSGERPQSKHHPGFPVMLPHRLLRGCPHQGAMPGSCRASPHPHALSVRRWLRRGARRGRGTQGTPLAGRPGRAEPGRKPLREGSSGLTNKSLTASPEAGGRKQAPWL